MEAAAMAALMMQPGAAAAASAAAAAYRLVAAAAVAAEVQVAAAEEWMPGSPSLYPHAECKRDQPNWHDHRAIKRGRAKRPVHRCRISFVASRPNFSSQVEVACQNLPAFA